MDNLCVLATCVLSGGQVTDPTLSAQTVQLDETLSAPVEVQVEQPAAPPDRPATEAIAPPETLDSSPSSFQTEVPEEPAEIVEFSRVEFSRTDAVSEEERSPTHSTTLESVEISLESAPELTNPEFSSAVSTESADLTGLQPVTSLSQITSVSQLSDVQPTDWAFQALQSLVERYGCIAGYPDGTFRGDRALSRYEFAAGLNACLEQINEVFSTATADLATLEDLTTLQRLQNEFAAEILAVTSRVSNLEDRTAALEANQFSTTTRLVGQAIFAVQGTNEVEADLFLLDGEPERSGEAQVNLANNVQLALVTSFTGEDQLIAELQAANVESSAPFVFTNMGRLGYEEDTDNGLELSELSYRFAIGDRLNLIIGPVGINPTSVFRSINPLEGAGDGAISLFGQRNPILALGDTTGGLGFDWQIGSWVSLQGVYSVEFPGDDSIGLFGSGSNTAGLQLSLEPTNSLDIGLNYLYSRTPDGILGTGIGDNQLTAPPPFAPETPFETHAVGTTLDWRVTPDWTIGGWGGLTFSSPTELSGTVETTNWMLFSAFPDLFGEGNLAGILIGQPPKIESSSLPDGVGLVDFLSQGGESDRTDTSLHLEAFYRLRLNDNISLTPGFVAVFNPNHNAANDTLLVGALRMTFQF